MGGMPNDHQEQQQCGKDMQHSERKNYGYFLVRRLELLGVVVDLPPRHLRLNRLLVVQASGWTKSPDRPNATVIDHPHPQRRSAALRGEWFAVLERHGPVVLFPTGRRIGR